MRDGLWNRFGAEGEAAGEGRITSSGNVAEIALEWLRERARKRALEEFLPRWWMSGLLGESCEK